MLRVKIVSQFGGRTIVNPLPAATPSRQYDRWPTHAVVFHGSGTTGVSSGKTCVVAIFTLKSGDTFYYRYSPFYDTLAEAEAFFESTAIFVPPHQPYGEGEWFNAIMRPAIVERIQDTKIVEWSAAH